MSTLEWGETCPAPAKINTFLHVIERLADGYHRLQTVFRLIGLHDQLRFFPRKDDQIRLVSEIDGINADNDLASRAARLMQRHFHLSTGVDIEIAKTIPMGSGLGGGSSNAATTLIALNKLWGINASRSLLQTLGKKLGADVPFFIFGQDAFADGVGDLLEPIDLPSHTCLLLFPPVSVASALIFADPGLTRSTRPISAADYQVDFGDNDLTQATISHFPIVGDHLAWLSKFGKAKMSGSGATVFLECDDEDEALTIFSQKPVDYRGTIAPTLRWHPLYDCLPLEEGCLSKIS